MSDYSELKYLAEKASPGPWWIDSHGMTMMSMPKLEVVFNHPAQSIAVRNEETGNLSHWRNDWDASYIAAANPKTVLALISEVESLKLELKDFQWGASVEAQAGDEARAEASALRKALAECAASLQEEMLQKFDGKKPEDMHPVTRRAYDRDMAEIEGYKAILKEG